jgi:glycosyltransferase involved in cell wall biosynthesis
MTGHCAYFDAVNCERSKTGCHSCPQKATYPRSLLFDCSKRNYELKKQLFTSVGNMTIVPVSQWLRGIVGKSFLGAYPCHVINNGVDVSVFSSHPSDLRSRLHLEDKKVLLGVAAIWEERKGFKDFMRLSQLLPDDYRIVLVGVSKEQQGILPSNMIGITRTESQEELAAYYSMADIVLNLSYQETFGMTTVEGLSCGTPGIVYDKTASPELIVPSCGKVVEAGDMGQLLSAISEIISNGKSHYSAACRQRAVELYNKDDRFGDYIKLYDSLLRQKDE